MRNTLRISAVVAVGVLVAAGCSSSSDNSTSNTSAPTTTQASTTTHASNTTQAPATTAGGSVMAGVPAPAGATQVSQEPIAEGGMHTYYTTAADPATVTSQYEAAVQAAGWAVTSSGGGGGGYGPYGGSGAGFTAQSGPRYMSFNAGGQTGQTNIDLCVWPQHPSNDSCGSNSNDSNDD